MSLFGSTNQSTSSWKPAGGLARSSSFSGPTGGSLFGNSKPAPTTTSGGLFGQPASSQPTQPNQTNQTNSMGSNTSQGGLFGNNNTSTNTNQGLFGNNKGLFGNNNTSNSNSGGLFGNPNTNSTGNTNNNTGLFGNSNTNSGNTVGGLFGNSSNNTGLGNNSNSGGLFSNNTSNSTSTGLFGNSGSNLGTNSASGGLFGGSGGTNQSSTGGLFGAKPSGLFGNSTTTNNNLFGNSGNSGTSNGLFGNSSTTNNIAQSTLNSNPYSYDQVITRLQPGSNMPQSITANLQPASSSPDISERKRRHSHLEKKDTVKSSLLNKLGQTFKVLRSPASSNFELIKGLFTSSNYFKSEPQYLPSTVQSPRSTVGSKKAINSKSTGYGDRRGNIKRLVIKSKPVKFHLINADKVLNTKRRRIMSSNVKTLQEESDDDEDDSINPSAPFNNYNVKDAKVLTGESVQSSDNSVDLDSRELNDGYWCSPSIHDLLSLSAEERTKVENFIIGRVGYGQIAYDYPVDFTLIIKKSQENNLTLNKQLFDKTLKIQKKLVLFQEECKAPIGEGLNVPATITLEGVEPSKHQSIPEYINYLKNQIGMEYVTYDPITKFWTFKVKHFSVWGLVDELEGDDELEKQKLIELKRRQDDQEQDSISEYSKVYENDIFTQEIKKQRLSQHTSGMPGGWAGVRFADDLKSVDPLKTKKSLVEKEINSQVELFKNNQRVSQLNSQVNDITIDSDDSQSVDDEESQSLIFDIVKPKESSAKFDYLKDMVRFLPREADLDEIVQEKAYEPELENEEAFDLIQGSQSVPTSKDWLVQLELANDINSPLNPFIVESQNPKKSLTISNFDEMIFGDLNKKLVSEKAPSTTQTDSIQEEIETIDENIYTNNIPQILEYLRINSSINTRQTNGEGKNFPIVEELKEHSGAFKLSFGRIISYGDVKYNLEEEQIFELLSALFDDHKLEDTLIEDDQTLISRLKDIKNKQVFAEWIKRYSKSDIEKLVNKIGDENYSLELIFIRLCAGNLKGAIDQAISSSNDHLAAILTMADSDDNTFRTLINNQLNYWKDSNSLDSIPKPIVKIYRILAGDFASVENELPWNLVLSLKLHYGNNSSSLPQLIHEFLTKTSKSSSVIDILGFYDSLQSKSLSISKIVDSPYLNTKIKWITLKVLTQKLGLEKSDKLSLSFGEFLTKSGLWKEALFVFSHIEDNKMASDKIRHVIIDNINSITGFGIMDEEKELVADYKVPRNLINEAISISKEEAGDYWGQAWALMRAGLWERTHTTVLEHLAPEAVISNVGKVKEELVDLLSQFPQSGLVIPDWNKGAGLYWKYIQLIDEKDGQQADLLDFLLANIPLAKIPTPHTKIAIKIISRKVGDLALERGVTDVENKINRLILGKVDQQYFSARLKNK